MLPISNHAFSCPTPDINKEGYARTTKPHSSLPITSSSLPLLYPFPLLTPLHTSLPIFIHLRKQTLRFRPTKPPPISIPIPTLTSPSHPPPTPNTLIQTKPHNHLPNLPIFNPFSFLVQGLITVFEGEMYTFSPALHAPHTMLALAPHPL
jgi:hypothetical protein